MGLRKVCPRYSLRTLMVGTLLTAVVLQTGLTIAQYLASQRRAAVLADIEASIGVARKMPPEFSPRMLDYLERRITVSRDSRWLQPAQQQQLLLRIGHERRRFEREQNQLKAELAEVAEVMRQIVGSDSPEPKKLPSSSLASAM
jgi:hypothetical protein